MKKLISILFLAVLSLFIVNSQKITYVDSLKSVTVNVSTDVKKQASTIDNIQLQLAKSIDSQVYTNESVVEGLNQLTSLADVYTKEIEKHNKSDGQLITDKFDYTPQSIKKIIRTERWLNLITWILCAIYILYLVNTKISINIKCLAPNCNPDTQQVWPILLIQCVANGLIVVFGFYFINNVLTLLFNGNYYVIQELINLYT